MFNTETWQQHADYVLAVLLQEETVDRVQSHWYEAQRQQMQDWHFPPGDRRLLYQALHQLRTVLRQPVHLTTVQGVNPSLPASYLLQLAALYGRAGQSTLRNGVFTRNVETVQDYGSRAARIQALENALTALRGGEQQDAVTAGVMSQLNTASMQPMDGETAQAMADVFEQRMHTPQPSVMLSGVRAIDEWTGGFTRDEFFAIVAPMKMRKTTLALNMALNMARSDACEGVALMMFESSRDTVSAQLHAMLATRFLVEQGVYRGAFDHEGTAGLSGKWLQQMAGLHDRINSKTVRDAIAYAINAMRHLSKKLRVYDRTRTGGNLRDIDSVYRVALWDKNRYGLSTLLIDHAQRIGTGTDYEKMLRVVPACESLSRTERLCVCLLSQVNSSATAGEFSGHASGAKGGADLDAGVDTLFTTAYRTTVDREETRIDELVIGLHLSRFGESGRRSIITIDPPSGLILNQGIGRDVS